MRYPFASYVLAFCNQLSISIKQESRNAGCTLKNRCVVSLCTGVLLLSLPGAAEWSGYVRQGWWIQRHFSDPREIHAALDASTGATPTVDNRGPVTTVRLSRDWQLPGKLISSGVYGRVSWYEQHYRRLYLLPAFSFHNNNHSLNAGVFQSTPSGNGMLKERFTVGGAEYSGNVHSFTSRALYYWHFDQTSFDRKRIHVAGLAEEWHLSRGKTGVLFQTNALDGGPVHLMDADNQVHVYADWEWENTYYAHVEWLAGNRYSGGSGNLFLPLASFMSLQFEMKYLDAGFAPLMSRRKISDEQQLYYQLRVPFDLFSGKITVRPEWGVKNTPDRMYWVPGINGEFPIGNSWRIKSGIIAEQPAKHWGAYGHYEYMHLNVIWLLHDNWVLRANYEKTFNGFMKWKEIVGQIEAEYLW